MAHHIFVIRQKSFFCVSIIIMLRVLTSRCIIYFQHRARITIISTAKCLQADRSAQVDSQHFGIYFSENLSEQFDLFGVDISPPTIICVRIMAYSRQKFQ